MAPGASILVRGIPPSCSRISVTALALAAESLVERGAADCRGVFLHLQDVRRDSLRLLCQLQDLCLVRAVDGGFAVGKVDGGLAQEGLIRRKVVMRRAEDFRDPARHSLHIAVTSVADQCTA